MRLEISELHKRLENTMIYVTHDQVEAMTMADKIVVLQAGVIEQVGSPLDLYNKPRNKFVGGFIGSPKMNQVEGEAAKKRGCTTLGMRPEHISLSPDSGEFKGTVGVAEQLGSDTFFHVHIEGQEETVTVRQSGQVNYGYGDTIYLTPDESRVHKFGADGLRVE